MDTINQLLAMLPATWQPYAIVGLIAAYLFTKWRSNQKTATMNAQATSVGAIGTNKDMQPNAMARLIEFLF